MVDIPKTAAGKKNRKNRKNNQRTQMKGADNQRGKGKKGKEMEVAEEETVSFIDCFVKVTDFGGPLFKPYDRRDEERNGW